MSFPTSAPKRRQHPIFDNHRRSSAAAEAPVASARVAAPLASSSGQHQSRHNSNAAAPTISISSQRMEKEYKPVVLRTTTTTSNNNCNNKNPFESQQQQYHQAPSSSSSISHSQKKQSSTNTMSSGPKISIFSNRMEKEFFPVEKNTSKQQKQEKQKQNMQQPQRPHRGVRPRLSTTCPVTQKRLLAVDDQESTMSMGTLETMSSSHGEMSSMMTEQDNSNPAKSPPASQSVFAHLTNSIVNYQKMVAELERLVQNAGASPETQWRTRILIRSVQDADRDLQNRLHQLDGKKNNPNGSSSSAALRKLHRDFGRVHQSMCQVLALYQRQQQAEVSFLNKAHENDDHRDELFFDRAMREREQEVEQIHTKMNQVNTIYQDLAALVDGQQEQIDKIAEGTEESKANTKQGLHAVRHGFLAGMCVPLNHSDQVLEEKKDGEEPQDGAGFRVDEDFRWSMPFETLGDDMRAVQADVLQFGHDFLEDLQDSVAQGRLSGCSSGQAVDG